MYLSDPGPIIEQLGTRGRSFVRDYAPTQPGASIREYAVYAAAATEALLDAIAHSNGTRTSISRHLLATRLADSPIGPIAFNANGDLTHPLVTIMRIRARTGVSAVPTYEGASFDRVIAPPASAIG
jgi:ABC-type branched-subunit amino acid transport system substrate-binding protein